MDQALYDHIQEVHGKSLFRKMVEGGCSRVVDKPFLGGPIPSAFERIARFSDPALEMGRLGVHEVHLACFGYDAVEDGLHHLADMQKLVLDGSINVRYMAGGRC